MATVVDGFGELPLGSALIELHKDLCETNEGSLATYIPPLAAADPEELGIAVVTVDGHMYEVGESAARFTIQSVSKPFVYGLALDDLGVDAVLARVGVEPTGDAFNSITVDESSGRPFNPMVNAGAIVTTSLVDDGSRAERGEQLLRRLGCFAGRDLDVDEMVFKAECATGDRNRAIAYLMRAFGMLREEVDVAVETYFRQCSLLIDTRDLAVMGATLANAGVNPLTGRRAVEADHVARMLSVMSTCGMYDYAGEWLYRVGLPAKSGVSGAVVAVLPGVLAVAAYSPRLDRRGNSVRGVKACAALASRFRLHVFDPRPSAPVRRTFDAVAVRSKRRRSPAHRDLLREGVGRVQIVEVQGPLHFGSVEKLSRVIADASCLASQLIIDVTRVTSVDAGSAPLLRATVQRSVEAGIVVVGVGPRVDALAGSGMVKTFTAFDAALEWCEDEVLRGQGVSPDDGASLLADQELLAGLSTEAIARVAAAATSRSFAAGATIFREGDAADAIYFILEGRVQVSIDIDGRRHRITTLGPGSCFGEMAAIDGGARSTAVDVEQAMICEVLPLDTLERLEREVEGFLATLYGNLARTLSHRVRDANESIRVLHG